MKQYKGTSALMSENFSLGLIFKCLLFLQNLYESMTDKDTADISSSVHVNTKDIERQNLWSYFLLIFLTTKNKISIIHSQILKKLNPRKSPRMPPQSATRDTNGKASTSFLTRTFSQVNIGHNFDPSFFVQYLYTFGFCAIWKNCYHSIKGKHMTNNLILHKRARHHALCPLQECVFSIVYCIDIIFSIFEQHCPIVTEMQTHHTDTSPRWLKSGLPHDTFLNTVA